MTARQSTTVVTSSTVSMGESSSVAKR
jgi:hypothetical protein